MGQIKGVYAENIHIAVSCREKRLAFTIRVCWSGTDKHKSEFMNVLPRVGDALQNVKHVCLFAFEFLYLDALNVVTSDVTSKEHVSPSVVPFWTLDSLRFATLFAKSLRITVAKKTS